MNNEATVFADDSGYYSWQKGFTMKDYRRTTVLTAIEMADEVQYR